MEFVGEAASSLAGARRLGLRIVVEDDHRTSVRVDPGHDPTDAPCHRIGHTIGAGELLTAVVMLPPVPRNYD